MDKPMLGEVVRQILDKNGDFQNIGHILDHKCNAWCKPPTHCDLCFSAIGVSDEKAKDLIERAYKVDGGTVLDIRPAIEVQSLPEGAEKAWTVLVIRDWN